MWGWGGGDDSVNTPHTSATVDLPLQRTGPSGCW